MFQKLCLLTILLGLCGVAGIWRWYHSRYTRFPVHSLPRWSVFESWRISRTEQYLKEASQAVADFQSCYGRLPFNRPDHEYQFSISLGHDLSGIHPDLRRLNADKVIFWNLPAGEQRDGWGNLFHYYFDHDGDGLVHPGSGPGNEPSASRVVRRGYAIWSDGPNGRDEGGGGDDIRGW